MKDFDSFLKENMIHINKYCGYYSYKFTINYNDLKSDVLEKIWKFYNLYTDQSTPKAWINTIVRNCCINYTRTPYAKQTFFSIELESSISLVTSPIDYTRRQYIYLVYKKIRKEYPGEKYYNYRISIYMFGQGYKIKEIADKLNITEGSVKSHIFRIREFLHNGETIII